MSRTHFSYTEGRLAGATQSQGSVAQRRQADAPRSRAITFCNSQRQARAMEMAAMNSVASDAARQMVTPLACALADATDVVRFTPC